MYILQILNLSTRLVDRHDLGKGVSEHLVELALPALKQRQDSSLRWPHELPPRPNFPHNPLVLHHRGEPAMAQGRIVGRRVLEAAGCIQLFSVSPVGGIGGRLPGDLVPATDRIGPERCREKKRPKAEECRQFHWSLGEGAGPLATQLHEPSPPLQSSLLDWTRHWCF